MEYRTITEHMDDATTAIRDDGVGEFYLPSRAVFERITPNSEPVGLIFTDGSFLVVKEIFEYRYPNDSATHPQIYFREYGYHYQRPQDGTFFRYDHHPEVGSPQPTRCTISTPRGGKKGQMTSHKSHASPCLL